MARSSPERIADTSVTSAGTTLGAALDKPLSRLLKVRPVTMNGLRFLKRFRPKRRCAPTREQDATPTLAWRGANQSYQNIRTRQTHSIGQSTRDCLRSRRHASIGIRGQLPVRAPTRRTCSAPQKIGTPVSGAPGSHPTALSLESLPCPPRESRRSTGKRLEWSPSTCHPFHPSAQCSCPASWPQVCRRLRSSILLVRCRPLSASSGPQQLTGQRQRDR